MSSGGAPKVSIITASFNSLRGLQETVTSVAGQSCTDFEHILVDGGSTDGTQGWLSDLDVPVRWISEPDSGIAEAMNKGVSLSSGEWLLFLHSDDTFVNEDSLEKAIGSLDTEADVVSHHVEFIERDDSRRLYKSRGFSWYINFKTTIPHQGAFSRRKLFDSVGAFDTGLAVTMDYDFFLRAHRHGARVDVSEMVVSRMPATGVSSKLDWESLSQRFREEQIIQLRHALGPAHRLMYSIYWPPYLGYRRVRQAAGSRWASLGVSP